ncbi:hypothetical protein [Thioalkalivibrio paradoxus]|uniref:Uncharacterized protein n=1 Tax=Thioalkalivibrio paradoxus ARh 1 TaxID=713585 RepID=W0DP42_9GAMM|nr:hypothetical protein [Thioalkalivibrio paradoxus]AHF00212.1 hypothetical protein THITH_12585 [Thioalkalivibrio paradoxus ARh 1]
MWKKVDDYSLNFHNQPRRAAVHLKLDDGTKAVMHHLTIQELHALGDLLRAEPNVWYHTLRGDLVAHSAPDSEEDLD